MMIFEGNQSSKFSSMQREEMHENSASCTTVVQIYFSIMKFSLQKPIAFTLKKFNGIQIVVSTPELKLKHGARYEIAQASFALNLALFSRYLICSKSSACQFALCGY